jgi:deoxyribose-phosphate aldolase
MDKKTMALYIDHTVLKPEATRDKILKVCREALQYGFASVCVNPYHVRLVSEELKGSGVKTCAVVGFPLGASTTEIKAYEAKKAVFEGANEVDMVINIGALKQGDMEYVENDIAQVVKASGGALVKVIIETCLLTDEEKIAACKTAKKAGAAFVKKCSYPQNLINASFENILFDLLNGSAGNKEIIEERIKSLHLDIKKYFYVLTIKVLDINTKNLSLASIKSLLEKSIPDSRSIMFGGNIVILINTNRYDFSSSRSLKPVTEVMEKYNLFGGLSRCFYNLIDLNHYHKQSLKAIELGMQNNRRKSLHIYDDYLIYHLLDMKSQSVDLKEFCHPKLLELLEYDSRHNTQYTYTLYVLLTVKGKQVDAANILNIHRSTMLYRMEKIEELTGLNVSEPKDIVQLYFSFIILKMTGKLDPELYTEFF